VPPGDGAVRTVEHGQPFGHFSREAEGDPGSRASGGRQAVESLGLEVIQLETGEKTLVWKIQP
jgi:hypothetical protein